MPKFVLLWLRFAKLVWQRFNDDNCTYRAAALTFTTLLSLVPLSAVVLAILSAFPVINKVSNEIQNFIFQNLVPAASGTIQTYLSQFIQQTTHLSAVGAIFLIVTAIMLLYTVEQALNAIWQVRIPRRGVISLVLYWGILSLTPLLVGAGFAVSSYVFSLHWVSQTTHWLGISQWLLMLAPFLLSAIAFTLLYAIIPNCEVPLRYAVIGGVTAALLFELAKHGFSLYIRFFPTYELLYGALAAIPIFLLWIYLSWIVILIGAEVSYCLMIYRYHINNEPAMDGFTHAFRWLGQLWQAQQEGKSLSLQQLIDQDKGNYQIAPAEQISYLLNANLIQQTAGNKYILNRDLNHFTLTELYHSLSWQLPAVNQAIEDNLQQKLNTILQEVDRQIDQGLAMPLAEFYSKK